MNLHCQRCRQVFLAKELKEVVGLLLCKACLQQLKQLKITQAIDEREGK
jgi:late competence protein required for DNA uptake (superfamily II DNA/RNA helicase)